MVSVFASSAVDCEFEPRSGQTNAYEIGICCFSAKLAELKTGLLGIMIQCCPQTTITHSSPKFVIFFYVMLFIEICIYTSEEITIILLNCAYVFICFKIYMQEE